MHDQGKLSAATDLAVGQSAQSAQHSAVSAKTIPARAGGLLPAFSPPTGPVIVGFFLRLPDSLLVVRQP